MSDITNLTTNTTINAKMNEFKGKKPSITNLATTTAFTSVENKIPDVSNLVKETDYNTKINEIEKKNTGHDHSNNYVPTQVFNKLTAKHFAAILAQVNLTSKNDIANFIKKRKILMINKI